MKKGEDKSNRELRELGVLFEQIIDKSEGIIEVVKDIQKNTSKIPVMEEGIIKIQSDMKIIKAAVTDTSKEVHGIDRRLMRLEAA